jgi:hypothetical protein
MKAWVFFENFVQRGGDFIFVGARFRLDGE